MKRCSRTCSTSSTARTATPTSARSSDPTYKPDQRLLVKVDTRVVSHVHLTEREGPVRLGSRCRMNGVMWVGTLPEYRGLGFAQNLMRLADSRARETGVPRCRRSPRA